MQTIIEILFIYLLIFAPVYMAMNAEKRNKNKNN